MGLTDMCVPSAVTQKSVDRAKGDHHGHCKKIQHKTREQKLA